MRTLYLLLYLTLGLAADSYAQENRTSVPVGPTNALYRGPTGPYKPEITIAPSGKSSLLKLIRKAIRKKSVPCASACLRCHQPRAAECRPEGKGSQPRCQAALAAEYRAEQQAQEAQDARKAAEEALAQVQAEQAKNERIISQFYFYAGEFALAYNNMENMVLLIRRGIRGLSLIIRKRFLLIKRALPG